MALQDMDLVNEEFRRIEEAFVKRYHGIAAQIRVGETPALLTFKKEQGSWGLFVRAAEYAPDIPIASAPMRLRIEAAYVLPSLQGALAEEEKRLEGAIHNTLGYLRNYRPEDT